jgi:hypothetical protein
MDSLGARIRKEQGGGEVCASNRSSTPNKGRQLGEDPEKVADFRERRDAILRQIEAREASGVQKNSRSVWPVK